MNSDLGKNISFKSVDFDPFAEHSSREIPTTEPQREIWTNIQLGGHAANCSYNESVSLHLDGLFDYDALRAAVQLLFNRHDALRSTFSTDGMFITISDHLQIEVPLVDLSSKTEKEISSNLNDILAGEAEHEFNLEKGPLGKIVLIRFSPVRHQLIMTFHHIVCDGWSLGIMMQDLGLFYSSIKNKVSPQLEQAFQYSDYALSEQEYYRSEEHDQVEKFWMNQFVGNIPALELPVNKKRPPFRTYNASRIDLPVDASIIDNIRQIGAKKQTSFVATLMSAFEVFIYRITGQQDIVVGLAAAGQSAAGMEILVGHCVNLLPLRTTINGNESFNDYLLRRKPEILDAYDNQRYTFGSLVQKLNIPRDPSRIPLVPVSFNVDLGLTNGVKFDGCTFSLTTNPRHYENFEFFINAAGTGNQMTLECTFNTDLFDESMMENRLKEFAELLHSISGDPQQPISELNILTPDEKSLLFDSWQGAHVKFPQFNGIHELISETARNKSNETALIFNGKKISYGELEKKSSQLAAHLVRIGVNKNAPVAIYMDRSAEMIYSILGILKAGAAYVPIDLSNPGDRIHYIINSSGAKFVITQEKYNEKIPVSCSRIYSEEMERIFSREFKIEALPVISSSDLCYIIFTSGSTGRPKGVAVSHLSVLNYIQWCNSYYFKNGTGNFGLYSSLSFDLTVTSIFCPLTLGKSLTIYKQQSEISEIFKHTFGNDSAIDTIKLTPAHILLLEGLELKSSSVKTAIVGGEELVARHVEILHEINPSMEIYNEYGPTEATVGCIVKKVIKPVDAASIGYPIANTQAYILDRNLVPVPPGIPGALFLGGDDLATGYHNNPEATAEKFIITEINGASIRIYNSGDLARYNGSGEIEYLGRSDNQVKIRGYRIEPGEIESELMKSSFVKEAVVVPREDEPGNKKLVAYLVNHESKDSNQDDIRNYLRERLPEYMVPAHIMYVDSLPLTSNGKIDKKALPSPIAERGTGNNYEEPATPVEQKLAVIWRNVLKADKLGRKDNFFELGGHSIIGVRMFNEVEKQLGVKLSLASLFRYPTIEELASQVTKTNGENIKPWNVVVPFRETGSRTPLFCIHMHNGNINRWRVLLNYLDSDQPLYAVQPRGLDETQEPHTTIEEMAAYYVDEIRKIQPRGPYNLIGLCFSGMVVFEMACILQQMGERVDFLAMVNNYAPPENPLIYKVKTELNKFMKMEMGEKFSYAFEKNLSIGKKLLFKAKNIFPGENDIASENIQTGHDLRTIHSVALLNYHPVHIYKGDLKIFRTADPIDEQYNEFLGWDRLIKGTIETTVIAGSDNDTIITDSPYNRIMSLKINEYLQGR